MTNNQWCAKKVFDGYELYRFNMLVATVVKDKFNNWKMFHSNRWYRNFDNCKSLVTEKLSNDAWKSIQVLGE